MKKIIITLFVILLLSNLFFIWSSSHHLSLYRKVAKENEQWKIEFAKHTRPMQKDENRLLRVYQDCFLQLMKSDPGCAKKFSQIMQKYE